MVVKVGSAVLARDGVLELSAVRRLVDDVSEVLEEDGRRRVVIVSSGAVAAGFRSLGIERVPKQIIEKQAAAAVGQPRLMRAYAEAFAARAGERGEQARAVGQVLLTADDIDHRGRFLNARNTLNALLEAGVVPIVNENDSVSFEEIKLGDNDHLAAMVAGLVGADALVMLSSVAGVMREGQVVEEVKSLAQGMRLVQAGKTSTGVGGMGTKIQAACTASAMGTTAYIADGREAGIVRRVLRGEGVCTRFPVVEGTGGVSGARKRWIGLSARARGQIVVDDGAAVAVREKNASVLARGIVEVHGRFEAGALVDVCDRTGVVLARGLSSYDSEALLKVRGLKSSEIERAIGYCYRQEAVHRSEMTLVGGERSGLGAPPARAMTARETVARATMRKVKGNGRGKGKQRG